MSKDRLRLILQAEGVDNNTAKNITLEDQAVRKRHLATIWMTENHEENRLKRKQLKFAAS